jgi:hypothetical protein
MSRWPQSPAVDQTSAVIAGLRYRCRSSRLKFLPRRPDNQPSRRGKIRPEIRNLKRRRRCMSPASRQDRMSCPATCRMNFHLPVRAGRQPRLIPRSPHRSSSMIYKSMLLGCDPTDGYRSALATNAACACAEVMLTQRTLGRSRSTPQSSRRRCMCGDLKHRRTKSEVGLKGRSECAMNGGMSMRCVARNKSGFAFERRHIPA